MDIAGKIAEERIREAMNRGDFDNLPGRGKPIDLSDYFKQPGELRLAWDLLRKAKIVPPEVEMMKELEQLEARLQGIMDEPERKKIAEKRESLHIKLRMKLERRKFRK